MLKRPNSRACALKTTASSLALPVPCVPGPREDARGQEDEDGSDPPGPPRGCAGPGSKL